MFRYISGANGNSGDDALLSEDGGINVRSLPEDVQAVFADIDANGDGVLDMEEFKTMLSTYAVLRRSNQEGSVSISTLPDKVQPALKVFDQDGDGTVDPKELMRAAEMYQASKKSQRRMRKFIIGLVLFVVALIGINSAMTFMMVEIAKETKASPDGVMRVNAGGGHQGAVVKTAANGEPSPLTSGLPDAAFAQLKQFQVDSPTGAHVSLVVQGWYRVPSPIATTGSVVKIMTAAGFIILDGTDMTFEETVGTVFSEAGFDVMGRKLLGMYEIVGIFNSIDDWTGLGEEEKKPGFGKHDFYMEYSTLNKCVMEVGAEKSCVDMYNNTHGAYVQIDGEHYIKIDSTILMDVDTNIAMESHYYAEFQATIEEMKSPTRRVKAQAIAYNVSLPDDDEESDMFYCKEIHPGGDSSVWNVTSAAKVGETEDADGRTIREFVITTPLTSLQHDFITNFDANIPYTGTTEVKYWDDKATGYPVKFSFGGKDFVVTKYVEDEIDLPEPDEWDVDEECFNMKPVDALHDKTLPTPVPANPYRFDNRRRLRDECEAVGGCYSSEDIDSQPYCVNGTCVNTTEIADIYNSTAYDTYDTQGSGRKLLQTTGFLQHGDKVLIYNHRDGGGVLKVQHNQLLYSKIFTGQRTLENAGTSNVPWLDHHWKVKDLGGGEVAFYNEYRKKYLRMHGSVCNGGQLTVEPNNQHSYTNFPSNAVDWKFRLVPLKSPDTPRGLLKPEYNYFGIYNDNCGSFLRIDHTGRVRGHMWDMEKLQDNDMPSRFAFKVLTRDGPTPRSGNCNKPETCRKDCSGGSCPGAGKTHSISFPPEALKPRVQFGIEFWHRGCGVKGMSLSGSCGTATCEVGGTFDGPDVCCSNNKFCGPGGSVYGIISQDLLELIKGNARADDIRKKLEEMNVSGSLSMILSYYKPAGRSGAITLAIVGEVEASFRRRQLLSIDSADEGDEGQVALTTSYGNHGRKVVWFKKTLKKAKKFAKKVTKAVKSAAEAFVEQFGFTNGVFLTISGYAEYDFDSENLGVGATIEGQACLLNICGDFAVEVAS
ncbi:predicted protein [Micromonas commoda]|uniref:EF-hand domain-containing protein n=1 Tax=Micromonas commoda (strain RCC299 / NOUM17 / CCMP2709) TaxID=296587 RepID=C1E9J2_MICCC|nr:predicted protein [Micromonas commoda]ACO64688.1 predicted protein [Micromonas commoda]|eukprot:XP_002503430.1 predicted protein [Micromonas commoda]